MRKTTVVLLLILGLCLGGLGLQQGHQRGWQQGYDSANTEYAEYLEEAGDALTHNQYQMSISNVRACILALDSAVVRFLDISDRERFVQVARRAVMCEAFWDVAMEYAPDEDADYYLAEGRFMYDHWLEQIQETLKTHITLITAAASQRSDETLESLYHKRNELKAELIKFRDHVERDLIMSWR